MWMPKMLDKAPVTKVLTKAMFVCMLKMSAKPLVPKFWQRQVVVVAEDIDYDMLLVLTSKMLEKSLYLLSSKFSHCGG